MPELGTIYWPLAEDKRYKRYLGTVTAWALRKCEAEPVRQFWMRKQTLN